MGVFARVGITADGNPPGFLFGRETVAAFCGHFSGRFAVDIDACLGLILVVDGHHMVVVVGFGLYVALEYLVASADVAIELDETA